MQKSSDFEEIKDEDTDEDDPMEESSAIRDVDIETGTYFYATLDEMKGTGHNPGCKNEVNFSACTLEMIMKHESFEDILAIVRNANSSRRKAQASKILEFLSTLTSRELSCQLTELEELKERATLRFLRDRVRQHQTKITKLKTTIAGINAHKEALCDFLIFRATTSTDIEENWDWKLGDDIPKRRKQTPSDSEDAPENMFSVPSVRWPSIPSSVRHLTNVL
jgi:hypothetical protein